MSIFTHFHKKDYFKEKLGVNCNDNPADANNLANILLGLTPFPLNKWLESDISENNIFDILEFLFDHISKPNEIVEMMSETNYSFYDYSSYNQVEGQKEFVLIANVSLKDYGVGYELAQDGKILTVGNEGLEQILNAEILQYDEINVDSKVRNAIIKWRNRQLSWENRREAIRELADVFEWLKKNKELEKVVESKDESVLFDIANNFAIRHHEPKQKSNYSKEIWYPWMFHFYLATYHASIRLLKKVATK